MAGFSTLPAEVLIAILNEADGKTVCRIKRVCRAILQVVEGSLLLQLNIELAAAGLVKSLPHESDSEAGALTLREKLARVRRYRKAWHDLVFLPHRRFHCRFNLLAHRTAFHRSGLLVRHLHTGDFECLQLSTPLGAQQERKWTIPAHAVPAAGLVATFEVDPAQDLLLIVSAPSDPHPEQTVSFISLRTGLPHTSASFPSITIRHKAAMSIFHVAVQHDLIMLVNGYEIIGSSNSTWYLSVYNWTTGGRVLTLNFLRKAGEIHPKVSMIGNHILIIAHTSVSVFPISRQSDHDVREPTCVLSLPASPGGEKVRYVDINPSVAYPHASFCRFDPEHELVLFTMAYHKRRIKRSLYIMLPRTALDKLVDRVLKDDHTSGFDWAEWGPCTSTGCWDGARLPIMPLTGLRTASAWIRSSDPSTAVVRLLEFGVAAATAGESREAPEPPLEEGEITPSPVDEPPVLLGNAPEALHGFPPPACATRIRMTYAEPSLQRVLTAYVWENGVVLLEEPTTLVVLSLRA